MPQVDFYVTESRAPEAALLLLCKVVEKGYRQGRRFHINVASPMQARRLDSLLWTFRDGSFVPHGLVNQTGSPVPPVLIGVDLAPDGDGDVLANLAEEVPRFATRFERIVEVVDGSNGGRAGARRRYRWYQEHSCEPQTHRV